MQRTRRRVVLYLLIVTSGTLAMYPPNGPKVPRCFRFTLIVADCIQVLGKPNRNWAATEIDNGIIFSFFQIITFYGFCAQFPGKWAQAKLRSF
jgi:hypothetical protein